MDVRSLDEQLLEAAEKPDLPAVARLLNKGAHVDAKDRSGWTSLTIAAGRGDVAMAKLLLDKGANYEPGNFDAETPWTSAVRNGRASIVELLLQKGIDQKSRNEALFHAVRDQPAILEMRAEKNTNTSDHVDPWTEVVKLLLENGAQINARDEEGRTPLIEAASYSRFATVKVLLERGADLEASDNHGNTALLAAACDCAIAPMPDTDVIVELLMKRGANINARNNDAETPLMIASYGGVVKTRIIEILVEHGANLRLKNRDGDTALMIARKSDVPDVVRLLEGALAQPH